MPMKGIVCTKNGPPEVLQLQEVAKPIPKDNEVLIKIHAATVTAGDCEQRSLKLPLLLSLPMRLYVGIKRPTRITVLGMDLAGEIESVGKDVKFFKKGNRVVEYEGYKVLLVGIEYLQILNGKSVDYRDTRDGMVLFVR